jgi:hypothetical protein
MGVQASLPELPAVRGRDTHRHEPERPELIPLIGVTAALEA